MRLANLAALLLMPIVAFGLLPATPALAHASPGDAAPAPNSVLAEGPGQVVIQFTESLEPAYSGLDVLDSLGASVAAGPTQFDPARGDTLSIPLQPLPNGTYTVAWHTLSRVDGHAAGGSYVFSIGEAPAVAPPPSPAPPLLASPLEPVFRWLTLLGGLTLAGALALELLVLRPAWRQTRASPNLRRLQTLAESRLAWLRGAAAGGFAIGSMGQAALQAANAGIPLWTAATGTAWGHLWLWRIGLLLAAVATLAALRQLTLKRSAHTRLEWLALGLSLAALLPVSLTSHGAATAGIEAAATVNDYLHLVAAALWLGGLAGLALTLPIWFRELDGQPRRQSLAALVPRFSALAMGSFLALALTGVYSGWAQVTALAALLTPYGVALLVKLGLAAGLIAFAAVNLLWVKPRLANHDGASRWLRWLVVGEAALGAAILLAVGVLTSLEPARQVASRQRAAQQTGLSFQQRAEGVDIQLTLEPGRVGLNKATLAVDDSRGNPLTTVTDTQLTLTFLDAELGEQLVFLEKAAPGRYAADEVLLSVAGVWQAAALVSRSDGFDARAAFRFEVPIGSGSGGSAAIAPDPAIGKLLWGGELALIGVLLLGAGVALGGWWSKKGALSMGGGGALAIIGVIVAVNALGAAPADTGRNPFLPDAASLATGKEVYQANCAMCHGEAGRGDGPNAAGLQPPPADLVVHVPLHPDHILFGFIEDGIPGTAMTAKGDELSDDEIWHVVNYIRTLK